MHEPVMARSEHGRHGGTSTERPQRRPTRSSVGLFVFDRDGVCVFANPAALELSARRAEQVVGSAFDQILPNSVVPTLSRVRERVGRGDRDLGIWEVAQRWGPAVSLSVTASVLVSGDTALCARLAERGTSQDSATVAGSPAPDDTAPEPGDLFKAVFDLLPVGVWIADSNGTIVGANEAARQIWRGVRLVGPDEYAHYRAWRLDSGDPIAPDEWGVTRAVQSGAVSQRELMRIQCFDGTTKTVLNWAAPIRSRTGAITGAIALNEDVSALHRVQEQLRVAVREREEVLKFVAHDLRTPLSAIALLAAALQRKRIAGAAREGVAQLASTLSDAVRQMSSLVEDLLLFAGPRRSGSGLNIRSVSSIALLKRAIRAARPLCEREGLTLRVRAPIGLPSLQVDADRVLRVFANLLGNAVKFTPRDGTVVVRAVPKSAGICFSVSNSGDPLSPDEIGNMFRPFWQAARGDPRGAGLGLSICRSIVEAHGGTIWAETESGQRVRVCFLLPTVACQPAAVDEPGTK